MLQLAHEITTLTETAILSQEQEDACGRNGRNVAFVLFLGGARATTLPETYMTMAGRMFPLAAVASAASVSGWVAPMEASLRFAMFVAFIYATFGFMPRADA